MSLFKCSKCDCIENTAVSNYWTRKDKLCSQCDPEIGKWHEKFPRQLATDFKLGNDGFLYQIEEVTEGGHSFDRIQRGQLTIIGDAIPKKEATNDPSERDV